MENPVINQYFDQIESNLISSAAVDTYTVIRKDISDIAGKIRIRVFLKNSELLDLFEYVVENSSEIVIKKYRFHWQDKETNLKKRWDNAPHHKELSNFPHHVHYPDRVEALKSKTFPNTILIIENIETQTSQNR